MKPAMGPRAFLAIAAFALVWLACSRSELDGELFTGLVPGPRPLLDAGTDAASPDAGEDAGVPAALSCTKIVSDVCGTNMYQPGAPWPTYQRCSSHQGRTTAVGPTNPVIRWKSTSTSGDLAIGPPSVGADGTIYVAASGSLQAFDPAGNVKWTTSLTPLDSGESTVAVGPDGTIFVALDRVYAVAADGTPTWSSFPLANPAGGTSVFGSLGSSGSSVALGPCGTLYIGSDLGLLMLDQDGNEVWAHDGPALTPAIDATGESFYGSAGGVLFAVQPAGATKWSFTPPAIDASVPGWIQPAPVQGPDGTLYYGGADGLYAIAVDGTERWKLPWGSGAMVGSLASVALGADGTIYLAAPDSTLEAISPEGAVEWSLPILVAGTPPIVDGDGVVFALGSAGVYAVLPSGQIEWKLPVPGSTAEGAFALGADGTLYLATSGVYAIGNGP
jgi:outer membrane protein assembly factor BamB